MLAGVSSMMIVTKKAMGFMLLDRQAGELRWTVLKIGKGSKVGERREIQRGLEAM
jgi:hypothetical protein